MNYFQANNLSKSYAEKLLFENISFGIDQGQKVALIARNGAGKTTLLNIMTGKDIPDGGDCNFRSGIDVAYLPQNPVFDPALTVEETLLQDDNQYAKTLREYHEILQKNEKHPGGEYLEKLQQIITKMDSLDAWSYETRFQQILTELKITNIHQPAGELSGGQSKRLALAKVLLAEADFIILDEPTNHLDLD
ncbi:MAG: ATP-binding cassette domain-containing protein, partial [Bacteroidota bacterium]